MSQKRKLDIPENQPEPIIKANVTESNGEISCSVEETNRIRALLGLKPLKIDKPNGEAQAVKNFKDQKELEKRTLDEIALKNKLEKAKEKRLLREKIDGAPLSATLIEEDNALLSASDWVKRSRMKEITTPAIQVNPSSSTQVPNSSISSSDLNLKISHGMNDFDAGSEIILTLADAPILEMDGAKTIGLKDGDDVLENVLLAEADRRKQREIRQKRLRQPLYSAYDDDEFEENGGGIGRRAILSQYDFDKKLSESNVPQLKLEQGVMKMADGSELPAVSQTVPPEGVVLSNQSKALELEESLKKLYGNSNDYYSKDEYATFLKPKKSNKASKLRVRDVIEEKESDVQDQSTELQVSKPPLTSVITKANRPPDAPLANSQDHGSRSAQRLLPSQAMIEQQTAQQKRLAYDAAVRSSELRSQTHPSFSKSLSSNGKPSPEALPDDALIDIALKASQERAKRLEQITAESRYGNSGTMNAAQAVHDRLKRIKEHVTRVALASTLTPSHTNPSSGGYDNDNDKMPIEESEQYGAGIFIQDSRILKAHAKNSNSLLSQVNGGDSEDLQFDEVDADGRKKDGSLVFTSTTEFATRLQSRLNEKARSRAEAAVKAATLTESKFEGEGNRPIGISEGKFKPTPSVRKRGVESDDDDDEDDDMELDNAGLGNVNDNEHKNSDSDDDDDNDMEEGDNQIYSSKQRNETDAIDFIHRQPLVAQGMAATLALLKGSGELKQKERLVGRAKDSRETDPSQADVGDHKFDVKLEYRDAKGRKLTAKEAFRELSYKFHGYGPGKKKKEKRMKAVEASIKTSRTTIDGGSTLKSLVKTQEATGKAHVIIQGGAATAAQISSSDLSKFNKSSKLKSEPKPAFGNSSIVPGTTSTFSKK